jgi:hypothetical protein
MVLAGFQSDEWRVKKKYSARLGFGSSGQKMTNAPNEVCEPMRGPRFVC